MSDKVRVFKYGGKITDNPEWIYDQSIRAHRLRNAFVAIDRERREAVTKMMEENWPKLEKLQTTINGLDTEIKELEVEIKKSRVQKRNRTAASKEVREKFKGLKTDRKNARAALKTSKTETYELVEFKELQDELEGSVREQLKAARDVSGLHWGTKQIVKDSVRTIRQGAPPKFKRFIGKRLVGIQIQDGITVKQAFSGEHGQLRLSRPNDRHGKNHIDIQIRLGSGEKRSPIWSTFRARYHRDLPDFAKIVSVELTCKRIATKDKWSVLFCMKAEGEEFKRDDYATCGAVAVNVGWRRTEDGIRAAYWVADDGQQGELIVPDKQLGRVFRSEDLQSIRDKHFDAIKILIATAKQGGSIPDAIVAHREWLAPKLARCQKPGEHKNLTAEKASYDAIPTDIGKIELPGAVVVDGEERPGLAERLTHIMKFKAQAKLASIVLMWRDNRFEGDEWLFTVLEEWRKRDKHLYEYQANNRMHFTDWRKDYYRNFARMLARKFKKVVIAKVSWKEFQEKPSIDETDEQRRTRQTVRLIAPYDLQECCVYAASEAIKASAVNITATCHVCKKLTEVEDKVKLIHECSHCKSTFDQDRNACLNLLDGISGKGAKLSKPSDDPDESKKGPEIYSESDTMSVTN